MNRRQFLATCALAGLLGACSSNAPGRSAGDQAAAQQFLTERNGGTPVALGIPKDGPLVGIVESVDGQNLTVKEPLGDIITAVQLAADAKIRKSVVGQPGDIKIGEMLTAFGSQDGDVFLADMIQLGAGDMPVLMTRDLPGGATPAAGNRADGSAAGRDKLIAGSPEAKAHSVSGTVEQADGTTFVVKDKDGKLTTVRLADGAKFTKQADVPLAELQPGDLIAATGAPSGDHFQATQVQIMPGPQQP